LRLKLIHLHEISRRNHLIRLILKNPSEYWPEKTVFRANILAAFTLG